MSDQIKTVKTDAKYQSFFDSLTGVGFGDRNISLTKHYSIEHVEKVLALDDQIRELSEELTKEKSLLLMGRGYNYATCLEGALKIKEVKPHSTTN